MTYAPGEKQADECPRAVVGPCEAGVSADTTSSYSVRLGEVAVFPITSTPFVVPNVEAERLAISVCQRPYIKCESTLTWFRSGVAARFLLLQGRPVRELAVASSE